MNAPKIFFLAVFLVFGSGISNAQHINFGIGYGIGTHTEVGGLDYVIGRYNDTRPWLSNTMENPSFFRGMNYSMEYFSNKFLMNFEWVGRKSDISASGTSMNGTFTRDYRLRMNSWNFGFGRKFGLSSGVVGNYLGLDFSTIITRCYTRVYQTGQHVPEYEQINTYNLALGFSPFIQHTGRRFTIKAYYQFMLSNNNYRYSNIAINSVTWNADPYNAQIGKARSLGLCLRYNLLKNSR